MGLLLPSDVQTWLEGTKLTLTDVDTGLEQYATDKVMGRLSQRYTITGWVDHLTTPPIVINLISMLVAAAIYRRAYSEDLTADDNTWAVWLEKSALATLNDLSSGVLDIIGVPDDSLGVSGPVFYPTDASSMDDVDPALFKIAQSF